MARRTLTYEEVAELLDYNPDTGNLVWKQRVANRVHEGGGQTAVCPPLSMASTLR